MNEMPIEPTLSLVGPGRAGVTIALALMTEGYRVIGVAGRSVDARSTLSAAAICNAQARFVSEIGVGAGLVVIATPDHAIESTAVAIAEHLEPNTLVMHLAGSQTLDVFEGLLKQRNDIRVGSLHPLQTLPTASEGLDRLAGSFAAIEGDAEIEHIADLLGVVALRIDPQHRTRYHAAAVIASNHVVALLGQVERLAKDAGVPFAAFRALVEASVENAFEMGPAGALTGPIARGDLKTVEGHLRALDSSDRDAYRSLAREATRLVDRRSDGIERLLDDLRRFE